MEGTWEIKEFPHQEEKCLEEKLNEEISEVEETVIPLLEETEMHEEATREKQQNEAEVEVVNQQATVEGKLVEEAEMQQAGTTEKQQDETEVEVVNQQANVEGKLVEETERQVEVTTEKQQNGTEIEVTNQQAYVEGKLVEGTEMQEETTTEKQQNGTEIEVTNQQAYVEGKLVEGTEMQEEMTTEKQQNGTEVEVTNQQAYVEGKLVEETCNKDSTKKSKPISKQIQKAEVTVAKSFTFVTEKRMSRERRGSMDFKEAKSTLSKSTSLNHKNMNFGPERNSHDLKGSGGSTTKARLKPNVPTEDKVDQNALEGTPTQEKVHAEEVESKKPAVAVKKHDGNKLSSNKLQKNSTFKALPLPRFYHHEDIHTELQKKKVTHSKPPLASEQGKTVAKPDNMKIEEKGKQVSRKNWKVGDSAKETISKLFRTTKSSLSTPKEKTKAVVSSVCR